jgi:hypothetical protein
MFVFCIPSAQLVLFRDVMSNPPNDVHSSKPGNRLDGVVAGAHLGTQCPVFESCSNTSYFTMLFNDLVVDWKVNSTKVEFTEGGG